MSTLEKQAAALNIAIFNAHNGREQLILDSWERIRQEERERVKGELDKLRAERDELRLANAAFARVLS